MKKPRMFTESEGFSELRLEILIGGEAPASTVAHTMQELAHNPEIQQRLSDELKRVVGNGNIEDHLQKLPFLFFLLC